MTNPSSPFPRRRFLRAAAAAGLAFPFVHRLSAADRKDLLRHASFGASGMAASDWGSLTQTGLVRMVAVAEVDEGRVAGVRKEFPDVKVYKDWRELLDKEAKNFDSVNVSTPDHMHGPILMAAIALGKHVYGQKPLTQNLWEARQVTLAARRAKVVSQMGIQIHSAYEYRAAVKLIQDGTIGKVKEVHTWSNKKWGDTSPRPDRRDPVPAGLDWDLWLGVATARPFLGDGYYHPANWRKRLEFGTGTFGDMGCHIYDPVFKALALTAPVSVRSEGPAPNAHNWATDAVIHYVFPATSFTEGPTVRVTWYDGDQLPPQGVRDLLGDKVRFPDQGSIFIGAAGNLLLPHIDRPRLLPLDRFKDFPLPELPRQDHYRQFADACLGHGTTSANFDYAGPLTETVLLGGVATRFPQQTLEWNAKDLTFTNATKATHYVRREYRQGWEPKWI